MVEFSNILEKGQNGFPISKSKAERIRKIALKNSFPYFSFLFDLRV
jgi:hypothetical protein